MHVLIPIGRFAVILAAVVAAGALAPAAEVAPPIADGVRVGSIDVAGMTSEPARREIARSVARPLLLAYGLSRWSLEPAEVGARAAVDEAVAGALTASGGEAVPLRITVDRSKVRGLAQRLARKLSRPARNARLIGLDRKLRPRFARAETGVRVRVPLLVRRIEAAVRGDVRETIEVPYVELRPRITARTFGAIVVIRRGSNGLDLYDGGRLVRRFRVATGTARYPTPLGWFAIVLKERHPWWNPPPSDWARGLSPVPPGPGNPLGTRWMGLSAPSVGIHGTPDAASIGYSASHGCIRMHVWEAEWLFERVRIGTPVFIVSG